MSVRSGSGNSTRNMLSLALIVVGALLLLIIPVTLLYFAVASVPNPHLPGTLVILSSVGGMALIGVGALLRA